MTKNKKIFKRSKVIFREGEVGDCAYIVDRGEVGIFSKNPEGKLRLLAVLKANDIFGEMGLIDSEPRAATAIALEDSEVTIIHKKTIEHLISHDPFALRPVVKVLSKRLREATGQLYATR